MQNTSMISWGFSAQNLKTLSDDVLLREIRHGARAEREAGLTVIHKLREIKRRRLHLREGHASIREFLMTDLKYSSTTAWNHEAAMEALEDLPDLEPLVATGELNLTNLTQVQAFCQSQGKSVEEKREIFERVQGLSTRKVEQVLAKIAPRPEQPEKLRAVDGDRSQLIVTLDAETVAALDQIRAWTSHSGNSYEAVIKRLAKLGLERLDPAAQKRRSGKIPAPQTHAIPAAIEREVWRRDGGKCGYVGRTGKLCGSTEYVQCDHIIPRALGGTNELTNLRLRCGPHNRLHAVETLGEPVMAEYR